MEIFEIYEEAVGNLSRYDQVEKIALYILEQHDITTAEKALSTSSFQEKYKQILDSDSQVINVPLNSIAVYLSKVSDGNNNIYCEGKKQGYYLRNTTQDESKETEESKTGITNPCETEEDKKKEKELYPEFLTWLECECDRVQDISSNKKMPRWNNPDLLGIRLCSIVGEMNIEITTIEVKRDIQYWRINIFEAIAHTIFANRVYFAFECKYEDFRKEKNDMLLYAQQYHIGLLAKFSDNEDSTIQQIIPAPYHVPDMFMKRRFLDALGIVSLEAVLSKR